jgi:hypothetical protein
MLSYIFDFVNRFRLLSIKVLQTVLTDGILYDRIDKKEIVGEKLSPIFKAGKDGVNPSQQPLP